MGEGREEVVVKYEISHCILRENIQSWALQFFPDETKNLGPVSV